MPGKSVEKLLRKLSSRKFRWEYKMFVAEGPKVVRELLDANLTTKYLLTSKPENWTGYDITKLEEKELKELSRLETANEIIGIFEFPAFENSTPGDLVLILDHINDPGNLGTILRTCDWFGVHTVYCTKGTTDVYNSKCIQSTMGSIARVKTIYASEEEILEKIGNHRLWVADTEGESIYKLNSVNEQIALVMGSESHGPSDFWKRHAVRLTIPRVGNSNTESLNVAQASAIIMSHLRKPFA